MVSVDTCGMVNGMVGSGIALSRQKPPHDGDNH